MHETHGTQEYEEGYDEEPTRHDEQIIEEMNATNLQYDPETESKEEYAESPWGTQDSNTTTHGYDLQPRPTKRHDKLNLMQVTQQSTYADGTKPHLHVLMMQMSVKAGIKKFGKKVIMQ